MLPFTLTEVLALLFFLIAFAFTLEARARTVAERRAEDAERSQHIPPDVALPDTSFAEFLGWLRDWIDRNEVPPNWTRLKDDDLPAATREDVESILGRLGLGSRAADSIANLPPDSVISALTRIIGNGLDHPPCWSNPDTNEIEYAVVVTLRTAAIEIRKAWPDYRASAADTVTGLMALVDARSIPPTAFRQLALPVLRWSQRQEPECRHFAMVVDSVPESKDAYKNGLEAVEDYFYINKLN